MAGNPHPFNSKAWHDHNAAEVASRPTAILNRKPLTPDQLAAFRPKPDVVPQLSALDDLNQKLFNWGVPKQAAARIAQEIAALLARIEALESAQQINPALAGLEKRNCPA
jgi:hypothetical protein